MTSVLLAFLLTSLSLAVPTGVEAQVTVEIALELGEPNGPGYVGEVQAAARAPDGGWLLVFREEQARIAVFDSAGTYQRRIGREGQGPSEFRAITNLWADRDSVYVVDPANRKVVILDRTLEFARSVTLDGMHSTVVRTGGHFYTLGRAGRGRPAIFRMSPVGDEPVNIEEEGGDEGNRRRALAVGPTGRLWTAEFDRYVLRRLDDDGVLEQVVVTDRHGLDGTVEYGWNRKTPDKPPGPALIGIAVMNEDRVVTLSWVADENWREGIGEREGLYGRRGIGVVDHGKVYDSVVDVWDAHTADLLGSVRLDPRIPLIVDGSWLVHSYTDEAAHPRVRIYEIKIDD